MSVSLTCLRHAPSCHYVQNRPQATIFTLQNFSSSEIYIYIYIYLYVESFHSLYQAELINGDLCFVPPCALIGLSHYLRGPCTSHFAAITLSCS